MGALKRRNVHASTITIGSAIHTGGRLQFVYRIRHEGEHRFAIIAPGGYSAHREIRLSGYYSVTPSLHTLEQRYLDDDVVDGQITAYTLEESDFSVMFDTLEEMAERIRRLGVTFAATGADYTTNPDGSHTIDYATGEEQVYSVWPTGLRTAELDALIALVDA